MTSKKFLLSSSFSGDNVTQCADVEQYLSTVRTIQNKVESPTEPIPATGILQTETKGSKKEFEPIELEIIETDALSDEQIKDNPIAATHGANSAVGNVVLRQNRQDLGDPGQSAFKIQARLSRMLQNDESSSDDEELYTIGTIPQASMAMPPKTLTLPRTKDGAEVSAVRVDATSSPAETPTSEKDFGEEIVSMKLLKKILNLQVLSEVKAHLKEVKLTKAMKRNFQGSAVVEEPSPAKIWEQRKQQQNEKLLLNKSQAGKLKAGWKVRQYLSSLPEGDTEHTLYFTLVKRGMLREVDALFSLAKVSKRLRNFNKDYRDEDDKSALTIAIDNKDSAMMSKLIEREVRREFGEKGMKPALLWRNEDFSRSPKAFTRNLYV